MTTLVMVGGYPGWCITIHGSFHLMLVLWVKFKCQNPRLQSFSFEALCTFLGVQTPPTPPTPSTPQLQWIKIGKSNTSATMAFYEECHLSDRSPALSPVSTIKLQLHWTPKKSYEHPQLSNTSLIIISSSTGLQWTSSAQSCVSFFKLQLYWTPMN